MIIKWNLFQDSKVVTSFFKKVIIILIEAKEKALDDINTHSRQSLNKISIEKYFRCMHSTFVEKLVNFVIKFNMHNTFLIKGLENIYSYLCSTTLY